MPQRARMRSGSVRTEMPSTSTSPSLGARMPAMIRLAVVLPAPFGPSSATVGRAHPVGVGGGGRDAARGDPGPGPHAAGSVDRAGPRRPLHRRSSDPRHYDRVTGRIVATMNDAPEIDPAPDVSREALQ